LNNEYRSENLMVMLTQMIFNTYLDVTFGLVPIHPSRPNVTLRLVVNMLS